MGQKTNINVGSVNIVRTEGSQEDKESNILTICVGSEVLERNDTAITLPVVKKHRDDIGEIINGNRDDEAGGTDGCGRKGTIFFLRHRARLLGLSFVS